MAVNVIFMGGLVEITMARSITVEEVNTVHNLYKYLEDRFPDLKTQPFKIMVNNEVINREYDLNDGDEVLLIAPHESA